jgi:hypothetical protein
MSTKPLTRIWVKSIKSLGLVDAGANEAADILIAKRREDVAKGGWDETENSFRYRVRDPGDFVRIRTIELTDGVKATGGPTETGGGFKIQALIFDKEKFSATEARRWLADHEDVTNTEKIGRKMAGSRLSALKEVVSKLVHLMEEVDDEEEEQMSKKDDNKPTLTLPEEAAKLDDAVKTAILGWAQTIDKRASDAETKATALDKRVKELESAKSKDTPEEEAWKALPEPVRKRIEETEKRARDAEEAAKAERDKRLTAEYVAKAQTFKALPVKADEFGLVLKRLAECAPSESDYAEIERVLKAAEAQLQQSDLFKERGVPGEATATSAIDEINKLATEHVSKKLARTHAEAVTKIASERPELYERYVSEQRRRI